MSKKGLLMLHDASDAAICSSELSFARPWLGIAFLDATFVVWNSILNLNLDCKTVIQIWFKILSRLEIIFRENYFSTGALPVFTCKSEVDIENKGTASNGRLGNSSEYKSVTNSVGLFSSRKSLEFSWLSLETCPRTASFLLSMRLHYQ